MLRGWRRGYDWQRTCLPTSLGGGRIRDTRRNGEAEQLSLLGAGIDDRPHRPVGAGRCLRSARGLLQPRDRDRRDAQSQFHGIIDGHTDAFLRPASLRSSSNRCRSEQFFADRADLQRSRVDRQAHRGSIPGWDAGVTWNREHSWPQSRGVDSTAIPDGSDMHHLFPSDPGENSTRGNLNYGGAFGAQAFGIVNDGGTKYYPGDLDAGMVARAQFYMAVRYDGTDSGTSDLELVRRQPSRQRHHARRSESLDRMAFRRAAR